jgi:hypothetical protein
MLEIGEELYRRTAEDLLATLDGRAGHPGVCHFMDPFARHDDARVEPFRRDYANG